MTCIVGISHRRGVILGGDSAGVGGLDLTVRSDRKVFSIRPDLACGFTTSFRMGQLLQYRLGKELDGVKTPRKVGDRHEWMATVFVDACRSVLKAGGFAKKDNEVERGGTFLVALGSSLFSVQGDYQVGQSVHGFDAVGCGDAYALGSLASTSHLDPGERAAIALNAAHEFSAGVRGPFHYVTTEVTS